MRDIIMQYLLSPSFKSHLENTYYIAGVFIAFAAVFGILQYALSRRIAKLAAKRDAYRIAADKCEQFGSFILPLALAIREEIKAKNLKFLEHAEVVDNGDQITINLSKITKEDIAAANEMENQPAELLNCLEAFALFFVSGVAAESPAFLTVGCAYCDIVKEMLPYIVSLSDDEPSYEHVKALYLLWQKRRDRVHLLRKRNEIDVKLKKSKIPIVSPIGV